MNNKPTLLLKRHRVAIVFEMAERKQAIGKKREENNGREVERNWKRPASP